MNVLKKGLFGTLSQREARLVMLSSCLTVLVLFAFPQPLHAFLAIIALVLLCVITLNQYHRVKAGQDPEDRSQ